MSAAIGHQFIQFAVVGGLGTLTNLAIFYRLVDLGDFGPMTGSSLAFAVAVTQNYLLNEIWTFRRSDRQRVAVSRYGKFVFFSLLALALNLAVLKGLIEQVTFSLLVIPQAIGIAAATLLNFATSRLVTFR